MDQNKTMINEKGTIEKEIYRKIAKIKSRPDKGKISNVHQLLINNLTVDEEKIRINAEQKGFLYKAPNGKKSNLPNKLRIHTRTDEFKKKFGNRINTETNEKIHRYNKRSHVVDENDEPMLLYHIGDKIKEYDTTKSKSL